MGKTSELITQRVLRSKPITHGERTIFLESTAVTMRWPSGGGVWNRPTAVIVRENNQESRIPIADPTRQALLLLGGLSAAAGLLSFLLSRPGK